MIGSAFFDAYCMIARWFVCINRRVDDWRDCIRRLTGVRLFAHWGWIRVFSGGVI